MIVRRPAEGSTDPFAREYADRAAPRRFADKAQPLARGARSAINGSRGSAV